MNITVEKLTDVDLLKEAMNTTSRKDCKNASLLTAYMSEHSTIRTQIFKIIIEDIPVAYSTHFLRHHVGFDGQWTTTNRPDRGGEENEIQVTRLTPTKHMMVCNAQAILNLARWRLCYQAHPVAREAMNLIRAGVQCVDPDLACVMMPNCYYHGYICREPKMCGRVPGVRHWKEIEFKPWDLV